MNRLLLCLALLFTSAFVKAQTPIITLKVSDGKGEAVTAATIVVVPVSDSLNKQTKIADSTGTVIFNLSPNDLYLVRISSVNYRPLEKTVKIGNENTSFRFTLQPLSKSLGNVVITANRPLIRQDDDKTIVDPEPLALASTNAYEILEKTPGLFVDQDGNIYLSSTTPARVYINGREQRMSAADIATILKSLPPNAIASIEIMRTPSAKYDASGSGGVVNVILRKGIRIGLTGSVNAGLNQGRYGNQFVGFNLNNNNGKLSNYINVQASKRNSFEELITDRRFAQDTVLTQDALTKYPANSYYIGYGFNYEVNSKWELNYDGRLSYNVGKTNSSNESIIRKISSNQTAGNNTALINNSSKSYSINQGFNVKYKIDSAGSEWVTDLSFTYSPNNTDQFFSTNIFTPSFAFTTGDARIENDLSFFSAATNLTKKYAKKITVETGLKTTIVNFENKNNYFSGSNGSRVKDNIRTGAYNYNENINAAYLQGSKDFNGVVLKVGTRLENTNMQGNQLVPKDTSFSIHRTDLFPYVYLSRNLMKIAGYDLRAFLVYRRTISRPAYENLNPSPRYIDPYLFESGNPSLRPQFTQNYEANISVDERPIIAIGVNDTKDIFNQVVYQADSNRSQAYRTYVNLGKNKETYFRALGALPPGGKYFFVAGVQYNHNHYQGSYENKPLQFRRGSWRVFTYHNLKLSPNTNLSLNGFVFFKGQIQFYELSTFGQMNMHLSQQFYNKKLTVSLSAQDIFYTNRNEFVLTQGNINATGERRADSRRFGLNLRYNFGIRKKEQAAVPDAEGNISQRP
ncbi:MAG TPA: outer membrane beta-barrel protein [Flavisolibacter sp.]|nr:outer membrane beta-barrel protein [Flavisolibacter sp.]